MSTFVRLRLGGVQAVVGGRTEGLHSSVVELARLHHALTLLVHSFSQAHCILSLSTSGNLWTQHFLEVRVARRRPHPGFRGSLCNRQCFQLRSDNLFVPSQSPIGSTSNIARLHAHRHRQVLFHILPRHYFVRLWFEPVILLLLGHVVLQHEQHFLLRHHLLSHSTHTFHHLSATPQTALHPYAHKSSHELRIRKCLRSVSIS